MSRKQWGHGYWQGVEDGIVGAVQKNGVSKEDIERAAKNTVLTVCHYANVWDKKGPWSLGSVLGIMWGVLDISEDCSDMVLKYIMNNYPYGAWLVVCGKTNEPFDLQNDYLILPTITEEKIINLSNELWEGK